MRLQEPSQPGQSHKPRCAWRIALSQREIFANGNHFTSSAIRSNRGQDLKTKKAAGSLRLEMI
jgi:hypothetical protein